MSNNALTTIPTNVPAHVSSLFARLSGINSAAVDGIGQGMYPIIKLSSTRFVLVKDGEESSVKSLELKVVILKAKAGFEKRWFSRKYDPNNTEAVAPDCFSMDGVRPAANSSHPQNTACSGCAKNEFNTGTDQNGNPGKGKACSDRKVLACLYPNPETKLLEVYGFSLPPASLKSFGAYVQTLTSNNIPLPAAFTIVGFDEKTSFPTLTFQFGGLLREAELGAIIPMIDSAEVKTIIDAKAPAISPVAPADSLQTRATAAPVQEEAGGFGFTPEAPVVEKAPRKKKEVPVEIAADPTLFSEPSGEVSDNDLANMLGLNLG